VGIRDAAHRPGVPAAPVRLPGGAVAGPRHAVHRRRGPTRTGGRRLALRGTLRLQATPHRPVVRVFDRTAGHEQSSKRHPSRMNGMRMNGNSTKELATSTFGNDDRLPRVPLPSVAASCRLFIEWCTPLLTADELAETEAAVTAFQHPDSPAHKLH